MEPREFDAEALFAAMDEKRLAEGLSWPQVAREIWGLSPALNSQRPHDHPISPSTITHMAKRRDVSCQHALFFLRWLGGPAPETFLRGKGPRGKPLPAAGPDRRLRWHLGKTYSALDARRALENKTWAEVAAELRCKPNQLTNLKRAKFAMGMRLAMRITQWLEQPAADFVYLATW